MVEEKNNTNNKQPRTCSEEGPTGSGCERTHLSALAGVVWGDVFAQILCMRKVYV